MVEKKAREALARETTRIGEKEGGEQGTKRPIMGF
jgi:hypothetical protein